MYSILALLFCSLLFVASSVVRWLAVLVVRLFLCPVMQHAPVLCVSRVPDVVPGILSKA